MSIEAIRRPMWTVLLDMMTMFLEACLRMAIRPFATVTDVERPVPATVMLEVAQVICDIMTLTT